MIKLIMFIPLVINILGFFIDSKRSLYFFKYSVIIGLELQINNLLIYYYDWFGTLITTIQVNNKYVSYSILNTYLGAI